MRTQPHNPENVNTAYIARGLTPFHDAKHLALLADLTRMQQTAQCKYSFSHYAPSNWELEWLQEGGKRQDCICRTMQVWLQHTLSPSGFSQTLVKIKVDKQ